jgi:hypothetical protein
LLMLSSCWGGSKYDSRDIEQDATAGNATTSSGGVLVVFNQFNDLATGNFLRYAVVVPTLMRIANITEEQASDIARNCIQLPDHAALKFLKRAVSYVDRIDLYFKGPLSQTERMLRVPFRCVVPESAIRAREVCQLQAPRAEYVGGTPGLVYPEPPAPGSPLSLNFGSNALVSGGGGRSVQPISPDDFGASAAALTEVGAGDLTFELEGIRDLISHDRDRELVNQIDRKLSSPGGGTNPADTPKPTPSPSMRYPAKIRLIAESQRLNRIVGNISYDRIRTLLTLLQNSKSAASAHPFTPVFLTESSPFVIAARAALVAPASNANPASGLRLTDLSMLVPPGGAPDALLDALELEHHGDAMLGGPRRLFMESLSRAIQQGPTASAAASADLTTSGPMDPTRFFMLSGMVPRLNFPVYRLASGESFTCAFGREEGARSILQVFRYEDFITPLSNEPDTATLSSYSVERGDDSMNPQSLNDQVDYVNLGYFMGARSVGLPQQFWAQFPGVYFSGVNYLQSLDPQLSYSAALVDQYAQLIQSANSAVSTRVHDVDD